MELKKRERERERERGRARTYLLNTGIWPRRPLLLIHQISLSIRVLPCPSVYARSSCIDDAHTLVHSAGSPGYFHSCSIRAIFVNDGPMFPCRTCVDSSPGISTRIAPDWKFGIFWRLWLFGKSARLQRPQLSLPHLSVRRGALGSCGAL